jgi:CubicO group peptidase (beta-lactamase class C family)
VTKTFNAVALAMLVHDGVIAWDDPVQRHIPEFHFGDAFRAKATTIRDLVSHRAGLPGVVGDLWSMEYGMEQLLAELPSQRVSLAFRERMEYSQVGIALLGEVVRRASGLLWPDFVRARILAPLGMTSSYAGTAVFLQAFPDPEAVPNLMGRVLCRDGQFVSGPWRGVGEVYAPAGAVVTTGEDMARFMLFLLAGGRINGEVLLPQAGIAELYVPRAVDGTPYGPILSPFGGLVAYCMGWIAHDFDGHRVVEHPGSNFGSSTLALVPSRGVGVFISSSATFSLDSDRMVSALKFASLAYALGIDDRDWVSLFASEK